MPRIVNFYLNFTVKFRLILLCVSYTLCIIAVAAIDVINPEPHTAAIILFSVLGAIFGWLNIWSIDQCIRRAMYSLTSSGMARSLRMLPKAPVKKAVAYAGPKATARPWGHNLLMSTNYDLDNQFETF